MNVVAFDTHAAVRKLREADISEQQAEALVEVFSHAIGEPATGDDIKDLATKAELKTELVALEARLTWRFAGVMLAQTLAILGGVLGILRLLTN